MRWRKLGLLFCASGQNELMTRGGRAPVPLLIGEDTYRVYFGSYDSVGRGRIFSLDLSLHPVPRVERIVTTPIIEIGPFGQFDDNGVIPSDVLQVGDEVYLYTIGFSLKNRIMFDAASGLAISKDGGKTFVKLRGPVLDRGVDDPCFAASPCVLREGDLWRMWYVSCDRWEQSGSGWKHFYNIKSRTSSDGVYWDPRATICINYDNEYEYAISRPSVVRDADGTSHMWYSYRGQANCATYRIGYARSVDGLRWCRQDAKVGIDVSETGWDSEMICYPRVFSNRGVKYMLYNGNHYGASGFGLAVLEDCG